MTRDRHHHPQAHRAARKTPVSSQRTAERRGKHPAVIVPGRRRLDLPAVQDQVLLVQQGQEGCLQGLLAVGDHGEQDHEAEDDIFDGIGQCQTGQDRP